MPPSTYMRAIEKFTFQEMIDFTRGWDVDFFWVEDYYTAFIQTYLMSPLTSTRGDERARASAARGRDRGARATRIHGRRDSQTRQRTGWPELPTTLTCWRHTGQAYQIPIEPALVGHELIEVQDSTPAPIEYTGQAFELAASLIEMV